jgi:phosphoglycolate phosphatase
MTVAAGLAPNALQPERFDYWVLDLDGTLVDVDPGYARSTVRRVGERLGRAFTDREADALWYGFGKARGAVLERHGIDPERFWCVFDEVEDPGSRAAATYLHEDAAAVGDLEGPVALLTHCRKRLAEPVLERHGIREWFDAVVCCTDETGWKPDPEPVRRALDGLGVSADREGALVGDNPEDVGAARNAGLAGIHVARHDPGRSGRCVLGDYRIDGLDALRN